MNIAHGICQLDCLVALTGEKQVLERVNEPAGECLKYGVVHGVKRKVWDA